MPGSEMWLGSAVEATHRSCVICGAAASEDARYCSACGNPFGANPEAVTAAYAARVGAWTIDLLVVYAIWMLLGVAVLVALVEGSGGREESGAGLGVGMLLFPLTPLYSALLHRYWRGQTVGKRAVRIAVVRQDGRPLNLGQSLARSYMRLAFLVFFPLWILDSLWPLWQSEHRSIHDHIANTMVVDPIRSQGGVPRGLDLAYLLYPLTIVVFLVVLWVTNWSEAFIAAGIVLSPLLVRRALRRRSAP